jgi:L-gulonolactone oxidase
LAALRSYQAIRDPSSWFWDTLVAGHLAQLLLFIGIFIPILEYYANVIKSRIIIPRANTHLITIDRSDKVFNADCRFSHYTTEWCVPKSEAKQALRAIRTWLATEYNNPQGVCASMPVEIRFSSADDIWLSPGFGRTNCWIGIVKYKCVVRNRTAPLTYNADYLAL